MRALFLAVLSLAVRASAGEVPPPLDLTTMGPSARTPTNERQTKRDVLAFLARCDEEDGRGDFEAALSRIDFPVFMLTDDAQGTTTGVLWTEEHYASVMRPLLAGMPKDVKVSHSRTLAIMSDSLVGVVDNWSMTSGKSKTYGRNETLLVRRESGWKVKSIIEAGWGALADSAHEKPTQAAPARDKEHK